MAKEKILIVDDSEMNRAILSDMLCDDYDVIEAEDGAQAIGILQKSVDISLVLLDIVMPNMDGFDVLEIMKENRWIEDIPVIMVSAETGSAQVERAYELGATDFIMRPFDVFIVRRRVVNTLMLYAKQKKLVNMVDEQIFEKEQRSAMMIDILSHIVEFRNGESGLHIQNVRKLTTFFLRKLREHTDKYPLSETEITLIGTASALHDIGKISIPDAILNKPGKLTDEEFATMKTHSAIGAQMLEGIAAHQSNPLVQVAWEICRWHHERYDGRGYPDGLKGDDIPISAQVVALADVCDALTSQRVYKPPFSWETAVDMVLKGQCGAFNPLLLECLKENVAQLPSVVKQELAQTDARQEARNYVELVTRYKGGGMSERTLQLLDYERMKYNFFASLSEEIQFEFTASPPMVTLSEWGAKKLGMDTVIMDPIHNDAFRTVVDPRDWDELARRLQSTTPDNADVTIQALLNCAEGPRWHKVIARALWSDDTPPKYMGAWGKAVDIHETQTKMVELQEKASRDPLTGLLNRASAREYISKRLHDHPKHQFALAYFDVDYFKNANDVYGHLFGDKVLIEVARSMEHSIRGSDIAARIGGDEFLLFLESEAPLLPIIDRIFRSLCHTFEGFEISVSMGVAETHMVTRDYETLFHAADQALYFSKRAGKGQYHFYDDSMKDVLTDSGEPHPAEPLPRPDAPAAPEKG